MYRKTLVFLWLTLVAYPLLAQETDSVAVLPELSEETTRKERIGDAGIFLATSRLYAPFTKGFQQSITMEAGGYLRSIIAGTFLVVFDGEYTESVIFPNTFRINYLYGGGYVGYRFVINPEMVITSKIQLARGDMIWERTGNFQNVFRDEMMVYQPHLQFEYSPLRFMGITAGAGYRLVSDLSLPDITSADFSGWYMGAGIKIGYFILPQ